VKNVGEKVLKNVGSNAFLSTNVGENLFKQCRFKFL
jgi:hypothetical protein